jgi:hypothetical protein
MVETEMEHVRVFFRFSDFSQSDRGMDGDV